MAAGQYIQQGFLGGMELALAPPNLACASQPCWPAGQHPQQVVILGPGSIIGDMSLQTGAKRSATVVALTELVTYKVSANREGHAACVHHTVQRSWPACCAERGRNCGRWPDEAYCV
jgi:hypothetical protein